MPSVFTKIIDGQLPARFVYEDECAVAFLSTSPITPGHTLVVPRAAIDQWTDAPEDVFLHCAGVARVIGSALKKAWQAPRVALMIAGFEVPHLHIHVFPAWELTDVDPLRAKPVAEASELDRAASRLRSALAPR